MKILYIAPVYKPAIGGGVVYLDMLSKFFILKEDVDSFVILTEKFPGQPNREISSDGKLEIIRLFPFRAGRSKKDIASYVGYFFQNLQLLALNYWVRSNNPDMIFVHSSFHNNRNLLNLGIKYVKKCNKHIKLISDVRDPKLPQKRFAELNQYDKVVSCSKNVTNHLSADASIHNKLIEIPVPVTPLNVDNGKIKVVTKKYGLKKGKYLFNGSGCSKEKGILSTLDVVRRLRADNINVILVVAGKKRYWDSNLATAESEGWFRLVGEIDHDEVIILSCGASLDINLSSVDSMPRHSLEAMAAGASVLLPSGVPEFDSECPSFVVPPNDVSYLYKKVLKMLKNVQPLCEYDWKKHLPDAVFPLYSKLIEGLRDSNFENRR